MSSPLSLAALWGQEWLYWWQIPLFVLLIVLIVGWIMYRRKQL